MRAFLSSHPRLMRAIRVGAGLMALFAMGLGVRRVLLDVQYRKLGADFPFTLESALHYRRVKILYDTGTMPDVDLAVGAPEGVVVRRTYEFGSERIQAALARMLPHSLSVGDRLRWIEAGWFCLGIPFLCLWLWWWLGDWRAGAVGGALYAVSIAAVMRSTGHELSKENFALPLLLAHLAFSARVPGARGWKQHAWAAVSACFLGWSLWNWDLVQFYCALWALGYAVEAGRGSWALNPGGRIAWGWGAGALLLVGLCSPYYRSHGFLLSPIMLVLAATSLQQFCLSWLARFPTSRVRPWHLLAAFLALGGLCTWLTRYGASYHHFADLLWAKIRHLNVKPADPSTLTFEQRIMWVPALNSATWELTYRLFPALLPASLAAAWMAFRGFRRTNPSCLRLLLWYLVSLVAFVFFVRLQVFLSIFAAALCGWAVAEGFRAGGWRPYAVGGAALLAWLVEIAQVLGEPERWGRGNVYYPELVEMTRWLRQHAAPDTVLSSFGISGAIAAYGKCAIVLHPKFEEPEIRDRVRTYGEHLFKGTELSLRDWADSMGAEYLVYGKGEFARKSPELQMRYFVDALDPSTNSPAWRFEFRPLEMRWFRYRWSNHKYAVYKVLTKADEFAAGQHGRRARALLAQSQLDAAEMAAVEALQLNPDEPVAQEVLRQIGLRRPVRAPARGKAR